LSVGIIFYWLRFLNAPIYALLVWLAYAFVAKAYPGSSFLRLSVPLMLVFFPQDVFYTMNNDVLSPLMFTAALFCVIEWHVSRSKGYLFHVVTGLLVAATLLTKMTNFTIFVPFALVLVMKIRTLHAAGSLRAMLPRLAVACAAAGLPVALWAVRNYFLLGDITGSADKIRQLGWTAKQFAEIWNHPVFTPGGAILFMSELSKTFWRGEVTWLGERHSSLLADGFYGISSWLILLIFTAALLLGKTKDGPNERFADYQNLAVLGLSVLFLAVISVAYDYGRCWYPSRAHPYFTSGRLISGVLVPFLTAYVRGLDFVLVRLGVPRARWALVLAITSLMLVSEVVTSIPVFHSAYNLFHMR